MESISYIYEECILPEAKEKYFVEKPNLLFKTPIIKGYSLRKFLGGKPKWDEKRWLNEEASK